MTTNGTNDAAASRKVISATCIVHPGTPGFTNLEVLKAGDDLILRPHATGACVLTMNETEALALYAFIGEMLD